MAIKFSKVVRFLRASLFSLLAPILVKDINELDYLCACETSVVWDFGGGFLNGLKQGFLAWGRAVYYALKQTYISGLY